MEEHVRKQQANIATKPENKQKPEGEKPESEKSLPIETPDVKKASMADLVNAIRDGEKEFQEIVKKIYDDISGVHARITNIETVLEQLQLTNLSIFDRLAKIAMALVTFVAKFGTKKDEAQAKDEVEA